MSQMRRASDYYGQVFEAMLKLRGWARNNVPTDVREDIWATMSRQDQYCRCFTMGQTVESAAEEIQHAEWDGR